MKKTIILLACLLSSVYCYANIDWDSAAHANRDWAAYRDSLAMVSRAKADVVLAKFDEISGKKILYSIWDKHYYIIIQENNNYKEYIVSIDDSCNVGQFKKLNVYDGYNKIYKKLKARKYLSKKKRKLLEYSEDAKQTVENAFDTDQYSTELITLVPDAKTIGSGYSYFVLKDESGNRYGEYHLTTYTDPLPINPFLMAYFVRELSINVEDE